MKNMQNGNVAVSGISKRRVFNLLIISILCIIMAITWYVGIGLSWFKPREEASLTVTATDFSAITRISSNNGTSYSELTNTTKINLGATNSTIGSTKLQIEYTGKSSAYIRVQLFETFKNSNNELYPATTVNYTLSSNWKYIDGYYYYCEPVCVDSSSGSQTKQIQFVDKITCSYNSTTYYGYYFNLVSVVETVQPDRFEEFFGFAPEDLTASPAT